MPGVQDRVIVVTGAGGGLGREYALTLAGEGASVVVNDLGGARDGTGAGSAMADEVVAEIRDKGGRAVANYDSVATEDGAANIIKTALDEFGAVHGVVSNAGILRDGTFHKMSFENWDAVLKVHLYGGYHVLRAAWPHFREQSYGRVVVATSTSGLFGNFGQTNYGAAKLGLVGLINTLALEGAKYNIHANALAPIAATRMTQDILPPEVLEKPHTRVRRTGGGLPVHRGVCRQRIGVRRRWWQGAASCAVWQRRRQLRQTAVGTRCCGAVGRDHRSVRCENCWIQVVEVNEGLCRKRTFRPVRHGVHRHRRGIR